MLLNFQKQLQYATTNRAQTRTPNEKHCSTVSPLGICMRYFRRLSRYPVYGTMSQARKSATNEHLWLWERNFCCHLLTLTFKYHFSPCNLTSQVHLPAHIIHDPIPKSLHHQWPPTSLRDRQWFQWSQPLTNREKPSLPRFQNKRTPLIPMLKVPYIHPRHQSPQPFSRTRPRLKPKRLTYVVQNPRPQAASGKCLPQYIRLKGRTNAGLREACSSRSPASR